MAEPEATEARFGVRWTVSVLTCRIPGCHQEVRLKTLNRKNCKCLGLAKMHRARVSGFNPGIAKETKDIESNDGGLVVKG